MQETVLNTGNGVNIIPYQPHYFADTLALFQQAILQLTVADYSVEQRQAWCAVSHHHWAEKMAQNTFLAFYYRQLAGLIKCDNGYLDLLFVHPKFARKGVATALYSVVERYAKQENCIEITSDVSLSAIPFFEKMGFTSLLPPNRLQQVTLRGQPFLNMKMHKRWDN